MSSNLIDLSTVLSIVAVILGLLVILPYFINRLCYKPNLSICVHCWDGSQDTIPRSGGDIQISIHAKNKQRVVVESASVSIPQAFKSQNLLPFLVGGDKIPPHTSGAPTHLIASPWPQTIGGPDRLVGSATFWCCVKDENASELVMNVTIRAHIYQGDLPTLIDMHTPQTREYPFSQTFRIQ